MIRGWQEVWPMLNAAGFRTVIPFLRGFGRTRFLSKETVRDGRGVALAQDVIDLADGLGIDSFYVAGHDWGARAAYLLAALFPARVGRIATMSLGFQPRGEFPIPSFPQARLFWYQWFMCTDGGADNCDPPSSFEEMDHSFTGRYELLTLRGVGHFPARESPEAVGRALVRHFRG